MVRSDQGNPTFPFTTLTTLIITYLLLVLSRPCLAFGLKYFSFSPHPHHKLKLTLLVYCWLINRILPSTRYHKCWKSTTNYNYEVIARYEKLKASLGLVEEKLSSIILVLEGGFWGWLSSSSSLKSSNSVCESDGPSRVQYSLKSLIPNLSKRSNSICSTLSLVLASCSSLSLFFVSSRSFFLCSKESFFRGIQGDFLVCALQSVCSVSFTVSFPKDVWTNTRVLSRSGGSYKMSEFRQDYLGNCTIPSHPLATYVLTRQDTRNSQWRGWR